MQVRRSIIAVGAAVVLATTGALLLPAVASAQSATHTLSFNSVLDKTVNFSQTAGGEQNTDVNAAGTTVGFDMLYFTFSSPTTANVNLTFDTPGGYLYGTATANLANGVVVSNGRVTGGTGAFRGACGTITITAVSSTVESVTISYSV
jgi:hypothetical protein